MQRATIVIPPKLKQLAVEMARAQGISFGEFLHHAVEDAIEKRSTAQKRKRHDDLLDDDRVFHGETPNDLSEHHDEYLYGGR